MKSSLILPVLLGALNVASQTTSCRPGFSPGTDEVLFTVPYTYTQVMSIIGSFQNLTWSGSPDGSVSLNGTDNTVGTARTYDLAGAHIVETIKEYSSPAAGPYFEDHYLDLITVPLSATANVSLYADVDATTVTPVCDGAASTFNFTARFCATNVTDAAALLHSIHLGDAQTVGVFLGGRNFSSCEAAAAAGGSNGSVTAPAGGPVTVTASSAARDLVPVTALVAVGSAVGLWALLGL